VDATWVNKHGARVLPRSTTPKDRFEKRQPLQYSDDNQKDVISPCITLKKMHRMREPGRVRIVNAAHVVPLPASLASLRTLRLPSKVKATFTKQSSLPQQLPKRFLHPHITLHPSQCGGYSSSQHLCCLLPLLQPRSPLATGSKTSAPSRYRAALR
jgi:hypothetical protein